MMRIVVGIVFAALVMGAVPAHAQRVTCSYDTCLATCQKLGGGNKQGGCSGYCDKTIRERRQSGVCKAK